MADYLFDAKMAEENTDGGLYDQDQDNQESKMEKEIKSEGDTVLYLKFTLNAMNNDWKFTFE